jgi:hypothetical protein
VQGIQFDVRNCQLLGDRLGKGGFARSARANNNNPLSTFSHLRFANHLQQNSRPLSSG